jgi:transcription elongation GreA/GreB family factor
MERLTLSDEARQSLEERLRILEEERIPRLENEVTDARDPSTVATLSEARQQAAHLRHALTLAVPLEDAPHDPTIVELGDTVRLRGVGSSTVEEFTLVGELEARLLYRYGVRSTGGTSVSSVVRLSEVDPARQAHGCDDHHDPRKVIELEQPVDVVSVDPGPLGDLLPRVSAHTSASIENSPGSGTDQSGPTKHNPRSAARRVAGILRSHGENLVRWKGSPPIRT